MLERSRCQQGKIQKGVCFLNSKIGFVVLISLWLTGCDKELWNDPYPFEDPKANTLYTQFSERPKHLDPAQSYSEPEWELICQIYEPPLQYHYLKRPYTLEPLTIESMPEV